MIERYLARRGLYYGWVIVAVVFLTMFWALGFRYAFGVFYSAILEDTGWQRAETASVFSISMLVYAVMAAPSGLLFDKLGARIQFSLGGLVMGTGLILCSGVSTIPQLLLFYGVMQGLSNALLGFIPHMAIVPRWFSRRRGLAFALSLAGVGVGSLALAYFSALGIQAWGWRSTLRYGGIATLVGLIPLNVLLQRESPQRMGLHPDGAPHPPPTPTGRQGAGVSVRRAMRSAPFWWLFISVSMMGLCSMTLVVHQTRMMVDLGLSLGTASLLFGSVGLMRTVGGLIWGPLSDRWGRTMCVWIIHVATLGGLMALLATLWLGPGSDGLRLALLVLFTVTFGVGYNGITPVYAAAVADRFAGPKLGTMLGLLDLGFGLGSATGPWIAGKTFDLWKSYASVMWLLMFCVAMTGFSLLRAIAPRGGASGERA